MKLDHLNRTAWKNTSIVFHTQLAKYKANVITWGLFAVSFIFPIALMIIYWQTTTPLTNGGFWQTGIQLLFDAYFVYYIVLVALVMATGAIRDEFSDQTAIYWLVSPAPREFIYLRKYLAYVIMSTLITIPGLWSTIAVTAISSYRWDPNFNLAVIDVLNNASILTLGVIFVLIGYGAVFMTIGVLVKKPLVLNLVIGFSAVFDQIFTDLINNEYEFHYISINIASRVFTGFEMNFQMRFLRRYWLPGQDPYSGLFFGIALWLFFILLGMYKAPKTQLL